MARYIDADELLKKLFPYGGIDKKTYSINAYAVYNAIQKGLTADVAPKAELANEIFAQIYKVRREIYDKHIFGGDLEDEQHEAIMDFDFDLFFAFEKLEKKYGIEVTE